MSSLDFSDVIKMQRDPVTFVEKVLGSSLWEKQKEIARSVVDNRTTAVRSAHGVGKTYTASRIALWWVLTRPYSLCITTAPTARQVTKLLWKEIRNAINSAPIPLGIDIMPKASEFTIDDDWMCIGFSTDDSVNFQGWHSPGGILIILDEAPGVPAEIWEVIEGVAVGEEDRILAIGNPVESGGPFYDLHAGSDDGVGRFHVSAFDVPNVQQKKTIIPGLCTWEWVEQRRKQWGEDSPMWASRVMGNFPDNDDNALVPLSWIEQANRYHDELIESGGFGDAVCMAVDVARMGEDSTVFACAHTRGILSIEKHSKKMTTETTGLARPYADRYPEIRVDADGLGAGVFDQLAEEFGDADNGSVVNRGKIREMRGGMRALIDPDRFMNRRAEWYWTLRERLDPSRGEPFALPRDPLLTGQLTGMRWKLNSTGKIVIESKDEMRKRGMKSPDEADAVVYASAVMPQETSASSLLQKMVKL